MDYTTSAVKNEFLESLRFLISLKDTTNKEQLKLLKTRGIIDKNSFKKFKYIILRAIELRDGFEFISFDNPTLIGQCLENSKILNKKLYKSNMKLSDTIVISNILFATLRSIQLKDHEEVRFGPVQNDEFTLALSNYIKTARFIRSNGFDNSVAAYLENIIAGDFTLCKKLVNLNFKSQHDFSKSFIEIAAPSLEGKTQFAFVLEKARPLYFALGATDYSNGLYTTQSIYLNFKELNICIEKFAKDDLARILADEPHEELKKTIKEVIEGGQSKAEKPEVIFRITADELSQNVNKKKLYTLGLFYKLVEDARLNYDKSRQSWMEYHARRTSFNVIPKSISELPVDADFFKGFSLFLDEFRGYDWAIYIRNLARAIGLRCCVSNTNAKVANLVGKHHSRMSGTAGNLIWSIVATELKLSNYQTLNSLTNIDLGISWIRENVISDKFKDDKEHFDAFFRDFKQNQIKHMRPGVSLAVAKFINSFCESRNPDSVKVTFESFFSDLVNNLSEVLNTRKPFIRTTYTGKAANLSLLISPSYNRENNEINLNSAINYLEDHFYYLINPSNASNWLFVTCPSEKPNVSCPLDFLRGEERINWGSELTFFKSGEMLTILACMNLFYSTDESFSLILDEIFNASKTLSFDTGSTENPLAKKRDGNRLEVLATLCASHSSHHDPLEVKNSFKGQCGSKFFINLLFNLIISHETETETGSIKLDFDYTKAELMTFNIQNFLEKEILIPYLYVSNFELPIVFHEMMKKSDIYDGSIKMGRLTRTTDKSRIDIEFPFFFKFNQKFNCKIECKNWKKNVPFSKLMEIFDRALNINQTPISITICDLIGKPLPGTLKTFSDFCCENQINAYKFKRELSSSFSLLPLHKNLSSDPIMIAFVIELKVINKQN